MKTITTSRWAGILVALIWAGIRPTGCIDKFCISDLCRLSSTCRSTKPKGYFLFIRVLQIKQPLQKRNVKDWLN